MENTRENDKKWIQTLQERNRALEEVLALTQLENKELTEQLTIPRVSNRRELLIDFFRTVSKVRVEDKGNMHTVTKAVDDYLKDN